MKTDHLCQYTVLDLQPQNMGTGMVFDVKRYALHDGPGIRVTVHFKGCPLSCRWCHNPESQLSTSQLLFWKERCITCGTCTGACPKGALSLSGGAILTDSKLCSGMGACANACPSGARELCGRKISVGDLMAQILKERVFFDQSGGGVTLSGGEPLLQPDFALAVLKECRKYEIHTAVDTCGFTSRSVLMDALPFTDLFLYDIKHMDPEKHREYTGGDNGAILSNLTALGEAGALINARMPFIPGVNTDEKNLHSAGAFLNRVKGITKVSLLPYHSAAENKHRRWNVKYELSGLCPPSEDMLKNGAAILESYGLKVEIGG